MQFVEDHAPERAEQIRRVGGSEQQRKLLRRREKNVGRIASLARALGLMSHEPTLFVGERSARYVILTDNGVISTVRVESSILEVGCTAIDTLDLG